MILSVTNIKEIHDYVRYILNKEMGGWESPEELDMLLHRAQMTIYNKHVDAYSKTQKLHDSMSPFSTKFSFDSVVDGIIQLPVPTSAVPRPDPQYEHLMSVWVQYYDNNEQRIRYKPVKVVNEDELALRLDAQILAPTLKDPVANEPVPGQVQLYPSVPMSGYGFYLKTPWPPKYAYNADDREITYIPGNSRQLEWNETTLNEIMILAIQLAGVNLSADQLVRYTMQKEQTET